MVTSKCFAPRSPKTANCPSPPLKTTTLLWLMLTIDPYLLSHHLHFTRLTSHPHVTPTPFAILPLPVHHRTLVEPTSIMQCGPLVPTFLLNHSLFPHYLSATSHRQTPLPFYQVDLPSPPRSYVIPYSPTACPPPHTRRHHFPSTKTTSHHNLSPTIMLPSSTLATTLENHYVNKFLFSPTTMDLLCLNS